MGTKSDYLCEVKVVDKVKVDKLKTALPAEAVISSLAETFKVLSEPTRTKIISVLLLEEVCVCDMAHLLEMSESAISHQLRILRNLKLVKCRKEGKMVFYSLSDHHISQLLEHGLEHLRD